MPADLSSTTYSAAGPHSDGARPVGADDEQSAASAVREMFDSIAPRYDLLNHVLSLSIDRVWWWRTARRFQVTLSRPDAHIMDVCCGTGDMTRALLRRRPPDSEPILAIDFAHEMLVRGARKFSSQKPGTKKSGSPVAIPIEADALHLPVRDLSIDLITTAFGFRNLANYRAGLQEFHRVLKAGGELGILDFSEPTGMFRILYRFYFRHILPAIGRALSGIAGPYSYLPSSVNRFPPPSQMLAMMREAGYQNVSWTPYSFGVAGLYRGIKAGR